GEREKEYRGEQRGGGEEPAARVFPAGGLRVVVDEVGLARRRLALFPARRQRCVSRVCCACREAAGAERKVEGSVRSEERRAVEEVAGGWVRVSGWVRLAGGAVA